MIRNESDILNVAMSEGHCKRPSGVRGGARSKTYVSKWTHGFKHIIHSGVSRIGLKGGFRTSQM